MTTFLCISIVISIVNSLMGLILDKDDIKKGCAPLSPNERLAFNLINIIPIVNVTIFIFAITELIELKKRSKNAK